MDTSGFELSVMVNNEALTKDGKRLVDAVGSDVSQWIERVKSEGWGVDKIATLLNPADACSLGECQRPGCGTGKSRQGSGGPIKEYQGALFCSDCMIEFADWETETSEAT